MEDAFPLREDVGRWVLPIEGREVSQIRIDYTFELVIEDVRIRIACPFEITRGGTTARIEPEKVETLAPLLSLHKATVRSGIARKDGLLELEFEDDTLIKVGPHDRFEAWEAVSEYPPVSRDFKLIAVPGGGLSVL